MAKNFGPGILGSVVLIDPETGLPYKAEGGGGGAEGAFNYVGDWDADTDYTVGQVVRVTTSGNHIGELYFALADNTAESPIGSTDNWKPLSNADVVFITSVNENSVLVRNSMPFYSSNPGPLSDYFRWAGENVMMEHWSGPGVKYLSGLIVRDSDWLEEPLGLAYLCVETHDYPPDQDPAITPDQDPEHWVKLGGSGGGGGGGGSANVVRSDTTDTYAYMGVAPSGSDPATDDWNITRIALTDPNNPKHAVGPWNDRATLTYA